MRNRTKTAHLPVIDRTQRARRDARHVLLLAFVLAAFASFSFIARHAGAQDADQSSGMDGRVAINSSVAEESDESAQAANAGVPGCVTPPANMAAWYPGDGNALDLQGGDSATLVGNPGSVTFATGKVAQAFQFNGAGRLEVTDQPALDPTSAVTLDAWVNPAVADGSYGIILFKGNTGSAGGQPYSLFFNASSRTIDFRVGNSSTFDAIGGVTQIPLNAYTHVAATYDGTTMRLYINGNLDAFKTTTVGALDNSNLPLIIGASGYKGAIDELEIFNRALAQSEIQAIVAAGSAGKCKDESEPPTPPTSCITPPANMTAWYAGDGGPEDIQAGNNGTLIGNAGTVTFVSGKVAQAFQFNGGGYVSVDDAPAQDATTALTLDAWINPASPTGLFGIIVFKGNTGGIGGGQPYSLFYNSSSRQVSFRVGNASTFDAISSFNSIPANVYTHVAATYDGTTMRLYLDGKLEALKKTSIGTLVNSDLPLLIGEGYQGAIDEVEIFKRVLSAAEIQRLFAADSFGKCKCPVITLSPSSLPNGTVGTPYSQALTPSAGTAPRTFAVTTGALPPGLNLNSSTGVISGTPTTTSGSPFSFTITVTDANGCKGGRSYTLTIDPVPPSNCVTPPSGMVAWLPGDNHANDISGNNHGTLQNGATFAAGKVAQAFSLDGVDDYVLVNHSASLMPAAITIDLWAYPTSYGPNYNRFVEKGGAAANDPGGYSLEFNPCADGQPSCATGTQGVRFVIWSNTVGPFVVLNSNASIPLNTWTHIAATFNGSTMSLYINGALQGTASASMGSTTDNITIGGRSSSHFFTGRIDELEIFNRALSQVEIQSIVDAGSDGKCKPCPTITLSPASLPNGKVGTPYTQTISAGGTSGPFTFSVTSGELPPGLTLNSSTGKLSGTPTTAGPSNFTVTATASGAGCKGTRSYTLTNDPPPGISINNNTFTEGSTGTGFTVILSSPSSLTITVHYATADDTAKATKDYQSASGTLTFAPGDTSKPIPITLISDTLDEPNETFKVNLTSPVNATLTDAQGIGTITDNDLAPKLSVSSPTVTETSTTATFTVTLSAASGQSVTVKYQTVNGTATAPADYTARALTTLTFLPGEISKSVPVVVRGDTLDEVNETFKLVLSAPTNATVAVGTGTGTITDNDLAPGLRVNSPAVTEGNVAVPANFTVSLSAPSGQTISVKYATANGTAVAPADYAAKASTSLTFLPGETSKTISVSVAGDLLDEPGENFKVVLSSPVNATIAVGTGTCTITDNDPAPSITITNASVTEPDTGTRAAIFTVKLSAASGQTVSVKYATGGGTAAAGTDYTAVALTTLTFLPGQTSKTFIVQAKGDLVKELNETFFVNLSGAVNASIADAQGLGTIVNDD